MADTVPLGVTSAGLYLMWFGAHYWRDQSTHWPSDPLKAILTGKPIPAPARTAAPHTTITVQESASTGGGGASGDFGNAPTGQGTAAGMVAIARSQIGQGESPPGSNHTKYGAWYGMQAEWCDIFVSWVANQNNSLAAVGGKQSYVPTHKAWFVSHGLWHKGTAGLQAGDIVIQSGDHHIGIATGNGTEYISGNWSNKVAQSTFPIDGYGRPRYSLAGVTYNPSTGAGL